MKRLLKSFVVFAISLYFGTLIVDNVTFLGGYQALLWTALFLTAGNFLIKPIIKFLLLPINAITLGLFRFASGLLTIWLVTFLIGDLQFSPFNFPKTTILSQTIPSFQLTEIWSLLPFSVIILTISNILSWFLT
ncbi:hypothetical protein COT63_00990 [Candidatus Shapirobacteria bacterium CG09_land_8_20_14_0_10_38_17]|uniref:Phage holin family protein n=1 Tax=Candidatus Shapirobacteria bacterium CG09_land_8_20_14_0_10_38_17 TaxID=1974884 RepID=A0A2H0WRE1_9BACT|nr:MAG: hypothetical protein COT63_00990 [Candidatus Shapirobacteria bacterium CG09_land_8_20_14_0_10_38_17]